MDRPAKITTEFPPASSGGSSPEQLETVLVSDTPDAATRVPDQPPVFANSNLGSSSLAALSQRYDILGEAGHGNMGNVYKARDRETGETVALKLIKPEIASDQGMMNRFKNELLFARKITHKNVCRVYDFNRIGGIACTSMEFVEGESLRSVLNRFGGLPVRKGIDLALQICSGLKEAHAQGIVHRDLKPENVMIDAQGNLKIMDFGIARSMEAGTRLTGAMIGTPAYMAPEQVAGKPVDYRTDIYSASRNRSRHSGVHRARHFEMPRKRSGQALSIDRRIGNGPALANRHGISNSRSRAHCARGLSGDSFQRCDDCRPCHAPACVAKIEARIANRVGSFGRVRGPCGACRIARTGHSEFRKTHFDARAIACADSAAGRVPHTRCAASGRGRTARGACKYAACRT